jgi:hypothetical protein
VAAVGEGVSDNFNLGCITSEFGCFALSLHNFFADFFSKNIFKIISSVQDWANFRLCMYWATCFLWAVFWTIMYKSSPFLATLQHGKMYVLILTKTWLGYILGDFFHNLTLSRWSRAGLPDGIFYSQNPNLCIFWRVIQWKMLVYFMAIWSILQPFGIFCFFGYILWWFRIFPPVLVCCTKKNLATLVWRHSKLVLLHLCLIPCLHLTWRLGLPRYFCW